MNFRTIGLTGAVIMFGLLALACTETTTVLPQGQEVPNVSVSGSGSAFGEPDVALLTLGVEAEADSVGEARADAAEAIDAIITALKEGGVDDEDIQTTRFSVEPRYNFFEGRQELRGFFVENVLTVKIRTIDDTGELIDAAAEAGGDLTRVNNLRFTIDDPSVLEDEARRLAMAEAKQKAQTLADEAGVSLGTPRSISESRGFAPIPLAAGARADFAFDEAAASTAIETGELEVVIDVFVVYELGD